MLEREAGAEACGRFAKVTRGGRCWGLDSSGAEGGGGRASSVMGIGEEERGAKLCAALRPTSTN